MPQNASDAMSSKMKTASTNCSAVMYTEEKIIVKRKMKIYNQNKFQNRDFTKKTPKR